MNSQKGLTLIEILIAVSLIIILGIGGYYFLSNNDIPSTVDINQPFPTSSKTPAPGFSNVEEMIVIDETTLATDKVTTNDQVNSRDIYKNCPENFTVLQTAGPYYKAGSPNRNSLIEEGMSGEKIIVTGFVFDSACNPLTNAWLDFWQADASGNYDNRGFKLRGHQYTDSDGKYALETVMPAQYSSRPPHIHLKLQTREGGRIFTSQLYFPGVLKNTSDTIFNSSLVVSLGDDKQTAYYNFKIDSE